MKFTLSLLVALIAISAYFIINTKEDAEPSSARLQPTKTESPNQAELLADKTLANNESSPQSAEDEENEDADSLPEQQEEQSVHLPDTTQPEITEPETPINFSLDQSTQFMIQGHASNEANRMNFKSELLPSNEVFLSIQLNQDKTENIELKAYFDLANFTMQLDGGNSVLNKKHKQLLKQTVEQLKSSFWEQYAEYDIPEHALMLTQMASYWSVSPEGFVHEKREIISR